jgi:hypothetical protein
MHAMLHDAFDMHKVREDTCELEVVVQRGEEIVNEEFAEGDVLKYYDLLKKAKKPLHEGTKHCKLSAIIHLYNLKCVGGLSKSILLALLEFIIQLLPASEETLLVNTYEAKKCFSDMGLRYEKILAYRNDGMLFWKDNGELDSCTVCGESKWNDEIHLDYDGQPTSSRKKRPVKVLRWFPLIPRLQRLFMLEHTTSYISWHVEGRTKDGVLRNPTDGEAWKSFDFLYQEFSTNSRNVRLGLTSKGFNPFGNTRTSHSTWPVMLVSYNLSP